MSNGIVIAEFKRGDRIITLRRLLIVVVWTLLSVCLFFLDDVIPLSETLSTIVTIVSMFMLLETFVIFFIVSEKPTVDVVKHLNGGAIVIGENYMYFMRVEKGIVVDVSMIEDSDKLLFVISDKALPSYA